MHTSNGSANLQAHGSSLVATVPQQRRKQPASPPRNETLSICIVNWNASDLLRRCLRSIEACDSREPVEVFVVDNASTDSSTRMVREQFPAVHLIESSSNQGFSKANNRALEEMSGGRLLLLNPDTELLVGALDAMTEYLHDNPEVAAVGPMLISADGRLQNSASRAPTLIREFTRLFHLDGVLSSTDYSLENLDLKVPCEVDVLQGACLMLRHEALDEVGLLDEDYFMYTEEVDLCNRLQKAGWRIHWLPTAKVIHHGGQSTKQVPMESFLNLYKSKIIYFRKRHGVVAAWVYKLILAMASVARLVAIPLTLLERREQRERHLALAGRYGRLLIEMPRL